jgi:cobyrinic acid a,c-diamide synthase
VLGCLPFDGGISIKERHLGIVPCTEHEDVAGIIERSRRLIENNLDIENIIAIANRAMAPGTPDHAGKRGTATSFSARCERRAATLAPGRGTQSPSLPKARIGVFFDKAFSFYYPENLEALQDAGAELIYINSFQDTLPGVDGLYIGGGFPELYPAELEANHNLRSQVCSASREGLPVYAECAGLMYLGRSIIKHGRRYAMAGVFDTDAELRSKPLGHGYMQVEVNRVNPFFKPGAILKGHEFHYSYLSNNANSSTAFRVIRGTGIDGHSDGLVSGNTLATYLHLHALSTFEWAGNFVKLALSHKIKQAKIAV